MKQGFQAFLNGIVGLSLAGAGATLSATIIESRLVPRQLQWLGTAGTLLAICLFPICFTERRTFSKLRFRRVLSACLLGLCCILFFLRLNYVIEFKVNEQSIFYLVGRTLTEKGNAALVNCSSSTTLDILKCAGPDQIPSLYGTSFMIMQGIYVSTYLMLLALFTALVSSIDLSDEHDSKQESQHAEKAHPIPKSQSAAK